MDVLRHQTEQSQVIGLKNRTVIPCPNGCHLCLVRGGLTYNTQLRGKGMPAAADALFSGMSGAAAVGSHSAYTRLLLPRLATTSMVTGHVTQIVLDLIELLLGEGDTATRARLSKSLWPLFAFAVGAALVSFCYLVAGFWALLVPSCILLRLLGKVHYCIADGEQS